MTENYTIKCCEMFCNPKSGKYLFVCFHCGANYFDDFEAIKQHLEEHFRTDTKALIGEESNSTITAEQNKPDDIFDNKDFFAVQVTDGIKSELHENEYDEDFISELVADNFIRQEETSNIVAETVYKQEEIFDPFADDLALSIEQKGIKGSSAKNLENLECESCNLKFSKKDIFDMHQILYHVKVDVYSCHFCKEDEIGYKSTTRELFTKHLRTQHKAFYLLTKPKAFKKKQCPICSTICPSRCKYEMHMETHNDLRIYKCTLCGTSYNTLNNLRAHNKRMHDVNIPIFHCDLCNVTSKHKNNLLRHLLVVHVRQKPLKCEVCGFAFTFANHLRIHMRTHTGEKTCQCNVCGKKFGSLGVLNTHIKNRHNKDSKQFKCPLCEKKFHTEYLRSKHELLHTDLRPYECTICGKTFKSVDVLGQHKYIHGEKRFKCRYCDMRFAQNAGRRCHEKSRHSVN